jgi:hypothetical protein
MIRRRAPSIELDLPCRNHISRTVFRNGRWLENDNFEVVSVNAGQKLAHTASSSLLDVSAARMGNQRPLVGYSAHRQSSKFEHTWRASADPKLIDRMNKTNKCQQTGDLAVVTIFGL